MKGKSLFLTLGLAVVLAAAGGLWMTSRAVTPPTSTWADVVEEAKRGGYRLITTQQLRERYEAGEANLLLVDTRQDWEYRTGHIRGAVNFSMEPTTWARWKKRGDMKRLLGPDKERTVVFY